MDSRDLRLGDLRLGAESPTVAGAATAPGTVVGAVAVAMVGVGSVSLPEFSRDWFQGLSINAKISLCIFVLLFLFWLFFCMLVTKFVYNKYSNCLTIFCIVLIFFCIFFRIAFNALLISKNFC